MATEHTKPIDDMISTDLNFGENLDMGNIEVDGSAGGLHVASLPTIEAKEVTTTALLPVIKAKAKAKARSRKIQPEPHQVVKHLAIPHLVTDLGPHRPCADHSPAW